MYPYAPAAATIRLPAASVLRSNGGDGETVGLGLRLGLGLGEGVVGAPPSDGIGDGGGLARLNVESTRQT
jgi:hypothetical protein